jgi:beta-galactosidase
MKSFLCFLVLILFTPVQGAVRFNRELAPHDGVVAGVEKPLRGGVCLNGLWEFQAVDSPQALDPKQEMPLPGSAWDKTQIKIPSPWNVNSFSLGDGGDYRCYPSYPAAWEQVKAGWLRRSFAVPNEWKDKRVVLRFEAVAGDCVVVVNGKQVAHNFDSFMPLQVDITGVVKYGSRNEVLVGVRKPELMSVSGRLGTITYPSGSFWGLHIAGIWQDVYLLSLPKTYIEEVFINPEVSRDTLSIAVKLQMDAAKSKQLSVKASIYEWQSLVGKDVVSAPELKWRLGKKPVMTLSGVAAANGSADLSGKVGGHLGLWSPESPKLYGAVVELLADGKAVDRKYVRFGWRQLTINGSALLLNGKTIQLKGDAWHFMGIPQMTRRYAWSWFKMLKDANANAVRLHAQPYPSFYLDVADEIGIMVLDESAIWASHCAFNYDDPDFWPRSKSHIESLIRRDRNHPSVFGWSVCNEINAALGVSRGTKEDYTKSDDNAGALVGVIRGLDPSRPWISGDGEEDMDGRFPVSVGHYGSESFFEQLAKKGKPYGIGEASSAYFGTPKEVATWYGDRSYESFEGRMEGIATEAYELIKAQRKTASYCSIFNLAWYGMKSMPIGLKYQTQAPQLSDGITFPNYVEGKPGVQPERIGPYSTAFNPGYDPSLPLYEPWTLFDAVKAAYAPGGPAPSKWDHKPVLPEAKKPLSADETVGFDDFDKRPALIGQSSGQVAFALTRAGVPYTDSESISYTPRLLIIDGRTLDNSSVELAKRKIKEVLSYKSTVMIWDPTPETLSLVNSLLSAQLSLSQRSSVSLVKKTASPIIDSLTLGDMYFGDWAMGKEIMNYGLDGPVVKSGKILLEACNTDWRRWVDRGENLKTGSVLRSERESKPSGAALVEIPSGEGRILICSVLPLTYTAQHIELTRTLMANLGMKLRKPAEMEGGVFDGSGALKEALMIGAFAGSSYLDACDTDFVGGETTINPRADEKINDLAWKPMKAEANLLMDFNRKNIPGPHSYSAAYLSFWLYSPRALDQLLASPDVPTVDLFAGSDDGAKIWLNGKLIVEDKGIHPVVPDAYRFKALPLKQGWNHFLVKVIQGSGEWQFTARLQCSDPRFLAKMNSGLVEPR